MDESSRKSPPPPGSEHSPESSAQPTSSSRRKSSTHVRPTIVLKRKSNPDPPDQSEKPVEIKSYAEMATKGIKTAEAANALLDSVRYDQAFPSLGTEAPAKATSSNSVGTVKPPIPTRIADGHKKDLVSSTPKNFNKSQAPKAPMSHRRNISHGGSKEIRNQHIPREVSRSVSLGGAGKPHFGLTQGAARKEFSSSTSKVRGHNSGHHNPSRSHFEGNNAKSGEDKEGHRFQNPPTQPASFGGYRGSARRHTSYSGRGRGRSPTSPGGAPPGGTGWRHEHWQSKKKKGTAEHGCDRIDKKVSPEKLSPAPPVEEKPTGETTGASDITRPVMEHSTDETCPSLERGPEGEEEMKSPTPSPKVTASSGPEHGHQREVGPIMPAPVTGTVSVAKDENVPPFSSGSPTAGSHADDTSASKPRDTAQQPSLQSSAPLPPPPPPPPPQPQPPLHTPIPYTFYGSDPLSLLPPVFVLPPIPSYLQRDISSNDEKQENTSSMPHQTDQTPRPKVTADEYFGITGELARPKKTAELVSSITARMGDNAGFDKKATTGDAGTMAGQNERYGTSGPSKVVQYAPTVQDKASKALAGHEKVRFGDIDSMKVTLTPDHAVSGNASFNDHPTDFADQHTLFAIQSPEVSLPPRPTQPPPGLPFPPGLPIPASYYQQEGITPEPGPGNISFSQPRERGAPGAQTIDNPQPAPGQHHQHYPNMGSFPIGQRSGANDSYLNLSATDAELKIINEAFLKYGQVNKEEIPSLTDFYGRRGAVCEQDSSSKGGKPAKDPSNLKAIGRDNFKERFEEVFGTKGKVSIDVLQEYQKKRLVAERIRNETLAAEAGKRVPDRVKGNTELFPYPTHRKSDTEVTMELLVGAFNQLCSYIDDDKSIINDVDSREKAKPGARQAVPWKKPCAGKILDWISDDNTSFFDQSFGKDFVPEGKQTTSEGGPSTKAVIDDVKLKLVTGQGGASDSRGSRNQLVGEDLTAKDKQSVDQGQASNTPGNVIFGPPKPPGYPNHMTREHLRPLKTFAPFEDEPPKVRYGLLPPNPRSVNTAEKSYITHRGGAVGPVADSAPRYARGSKGYLEPAKDVPPLPPADPSPFSQPKVAPSPFAALEQALGTTRFTQGVHQPSLLESPKPPLGAKPTGGLVTDTISGFLRVNYGGRQTQLDPDGSGLSRSEVIKRKQRPGERIGINFYGPNGMEFDVDKTDLNPAEPNTLGGKFKLKSQLLKEQEAPRTQLSQLSQHPQVGGAQPATLAKGATIQGGGSRSGSGTHSISDMLPTGNPRPGPSTPGNWAAQGSPEAKRGTKGWNSGMGGRE